MNTLTNKQQQAINTKLKIVDTTMNLLKHNDLSSIKISDICSTANISIGAFYHHFKGKNDVVNVGIESIDLLVVNAVKNYAWQNTYEDITYIISIMCELLSDHGVIFVSGLITELLNITNDNYLLKQNRIFRQLLLERLKTIQKNGYIPNAISIEEVAYDISKIKRGVFLDWCLHNGCFDLSEAAKKDILQYLHSLTNTSSRSYL